MNLPDDKQLIELTKMVSRNRKVITGIFIPRHLSLPEKLRKRHYR